MTPLPDTLLESLAAEAVREGLADALFTRVPTPIGDLTVVSGDRGIVRVGFHEDPEDVILAEAAAGLGPRVLRALRAYPRLAHGDHLRAGLFRITTNAALDHHRRGRREVAVPEVDAGATTDERDGFEDLIAPLTHSAQTTLRLRFVEDLEYEAIAARLHCTPEAARQRVSHALRTLRRTTA